MQPVIFVGHGNPMNAIEENRYTQAWSEIGKSLEKPKAIVVISAHWETVGTFVTAMKQPKTIHDFYGFPQALFEVEYNPAGSPELAEEIVSRVGKTKVQLDYDWGLDHGSWSVLKHLFPEADVPTIQISMDRTMSAADHYQFAKELQFLRSEGVLILGSGNIVHNLRMVNFREKSGSDWAISANEIIKELVLSDQHASLIDYQNLGSDVQLSIPTREHFLPLLYTMALKKEDENIGVFNDVVEYASLSMTSFLIGKEI